ncbi:ricin B lectin domain-containing protein [Mycena filopes]|nr:ricin B lectin domain-containing protein [Mycena filopes]
MRCASAYPVRLPRPLSPCLQYASLFLLPRHSFLVFVIRCVFVDSFKLAPPKSPNNGLLFEQINQKAPKAIFRRRVNSRRNMIPTCARVPVQFHINTRAQASSSPSSSSVHTHTHIIMKSVTALYTLALVSAVAAMPTPRATGPVYRIHPNGDTTKCVGVLGGAFVAGAAVDIYDCNGSTTQKWYGSSPRMANPADGSEWALDIAYPSGSPNPVLANGVRAVLKRSADGGEEGSPTQSWNGFTGSKAPSAIRLNLATPTQEFCLDLTNGVKTNQNPLQIWECFAGNTNQKWSFEVVA